MNKDFSPETKRIVNLYYDVSQGLTTNASQIYKKLNKEIQLKKIKEVIDKLQQKQLKYDEQDKNFNIPIFSEANTYQIDLTFYNDIKTVNAGFGTIMNIININTKYLYSYLMKDKKGDTIITHFKKFLDDLKKDGNTIEILESNSGKEWTNNFKKLCQENKIKLILFNANI